jgi:GT2 family glycosyltransferase
MPKVSVILVLFNSRNFLPPVMEAVFRQTHQDLEVFSVITASTDGTKDFIRQNYPQVKILDKGYNTGFAAGNNWAIQESSGEFIQLVNPDLIMQPDYIEKMLQAFQDPKVAAATGKLLRYNFDTNEKSGVIDSTGIVMSKSGRGRDRGQLEEDKGQYDDAREVFGVSGAGPMYRRSALEAIKFEKEYFDEDFGSYWEDVDLSWRLNNAGFKNVYVPEALAYHGRTAGQAKGGYLHVMNFIRHHSRLPSKILKLNYKNHILMYLKNARFIHPAFILREIAMLGYVLVFETRTLGVIPEMVRLYPRMRIKRAAAHK